MAAACPAVVISPSVERLLEELGRAPRRRRARLRPLARRRACRSPQARQAFGGSRVIVVSSALLGAGVRSALGAGASAFVDEAQLEATLTAATRSALAGQVSLPA